MVTDAERFAKVAVKELKLEKPKDEPKEEPKPRSRRRRPRTPAQEKPEARGKIKGARQHARSPEADSSETARKVADKETGGQRAQRPGEPRPQNAGPGRSDLKSLVSNIAAVRTPGGTASNFKVAGVIGKIPGGGVRLAGGIGGGGGKDTQVGQPAARRGPAGRQRSRRRRHRHPRAGTGAASAPTRAIQATGGTLDRGRDPEGGQRPHGGDPALLRGPAAQEPGAGGQDRLRLGDPTVGRRSRRRARSRHRCARPAVSTCILALIRTWRFPQPVGGSVQVRYPFVFRVQGF